ncbi:MAG: hypothetical protein IJ262_06270 [Clostridia bacterium]|nr:hypothetical protein [Clostridia bacterium]
MKNIWEFLLQNISVSLVASFLLIIKAVFKDKLSPRWQYGVWSVLALRILLPVKADRFVLLPFSIYLEAMKAFVETRLSSAFTNPISVTEPSFAIPFISGRPESITDFLFIIYVSGFVLTLCFYFVSYIRLRFALRRGIEPSDEEKAFVKTVFEENKVRFVRIIKVNGIKSAFICGVFKPVLVLPEDRKTDEKILLHEIMHLKHLDSFQTVFWCFLRCLNWCNPLMHYVFNCIANDMESLCDQRVLEKLKGEERRDYGALLLNEVNEKYSRMPATTSVSNGGKNISKRIEAIVRFKKYPKGMALVSVCIVIVLALPCLFVSAKSNCDEAVYYPHNSIQLQKAVACSKIFRCTTVAGAIDTYAKGLINENAVMLLTASPTEKHKELIDQLSESYNIESGFEPYQSSDTMPFAIFNLIKTEKEKYSALLVFSIAEENKEKTNENKIEGDSLIIPIEVFKENNGWVVVETGKRKHSGAYLDKSSYNQVHNLTDELSPLVYINQKGKNGNLEYSLITTFRVLYDQNPSNNIFFEGERGFDNSVYRNGEFSSCIAEANIVYSYEGKDSESVKHVGIEYSEEKSHEFSEIFSELGSNLASSYTDGSGKRAYSVNGYEPWDKTIFDSSYNSNIEPEALMEGYERDLKYALYVDGELKDEFILEVRTDE